MKVLLRDEIVKADAWTIKNEPIASIDLMEKASLAFTQKFTAIFHPNNHTIKIFCGTGNNGGDGLAIARLLMAEAYKTETYIVRLGSASSPDFNVNFKRLKDFSGSKVEDVNAENLPEISENEIVIDAIFGSGLSRPVEGIAAKVISHINGSGARVVSVDIPSGMYCDSIAEGSNIIKALNTISLELPKLSFFFPENAEFTGKWEVVPIGLSKSFIEKSETPYHYTLYDEIFPVFNPRKKFAHKGHFGHVLIIAGSNGKAGAAVLAVKSCLRTGAGLVTSAVPSGIRDVLQISVPEAMVIADADSDFISRIPTNINDFKSVCIGPGLGNSHTTRESLMNLYDSYNGRLVIDADALNLTSNDINLSKKLPKNSILTPHPKEFERLAGEYQNSQKRLEAARALAKDKQLTICLKGAYTAVIYPNGEVHFNSTGNPGMATAGSGDVLSGIIAALLAQNFTIENSARYGVFLHGLAADLAMERKGETSLIAGDIIGYLYHATKMLTKKL